MKLFVHIMIGCLLALGEMAFRTHLPWGLHDLPCVFLLSLYMVIRYHKWEASIWLLVYAFIVDLFGFFLSPFTTVAYLIILTLNIYAATHLLTNRSIYGVGIGVIGSFILLHLIEYLFTYKHILQSSIGLSGWMIDQVWIALLLLMTLWFFYVLEGVWKRQFRV